MPREQWDEKTGEKFDSLEIRVAREMIKHLESRQLNIKKGNATLLLQSWSTSRILLHHPLLYI